MAATLLVVVSCASLVLGQGPPIHYFHQGVMPPGAIGQVQLARGGPVAGYFQPVEIRAPGGVLISLAEEGRFAQPQAAPVKAGCLIGQVYRLRVMNIPLNPGAEVFPTIEIVDRLYSPRGREQRFPIVVEITQDDLLLAMSGKFVTRVIYLEDPRQALPVASDPARQTWFDAPSGRDPLAVADEMGRPMAILRMGAIVPDGSGGWDPAFLFGCPPLMKYLPGEVSAAMAPSPTAGVPRQSTTVWESLAR